MSGARRFFAVALALGSIRCAEPAPRPPYDPSNPPKSQSCHRVDVDGIECVVCSRAWDNVAVSCNWPPSKAEKLD